MLAIELIFPGGRGGGRYHATPWDAHVNEGAVEWPPSPWRLLRALIATRHLKARDEVREDTLRSLVDALSVELPGYALPAQAAGAHTRHYMPPFSGNTIKVFDTFLHFGQAARIVVAWPETTLGADLTAALDCLVSRLGYLGRAEAWVEARLCDAESTTLDCRPADAATRAGQAGPDEDREIVRVLAPVPPMDLARWRAAALDERITRALDEKRGRARDKGKLTDNVKLSPREVAALEAALPSSVYEALLAETDVMRKHGWSRPPGSRWVEYRRPRLGARPVRRIKSASRDLPTVARYALAGNVLPRLTDAVLEAEKIRIALLSHSDGAPVFAGREPGTRELVSGHLHTFILPEANARHGHITHVTLYARMGFDERARAALERLRTVWQRSGHDLQLVLLGVGQPQDFAGTRTEIGQCPLLARSNTWESRTPFVSTRHEKRKANGEPRLDEHGVVVGSAEHDLIRLLLSQGFPRPVSVQVIPDTLLGGRPTRWLAFRTERMKGHGRRAAGHGWGFRVIFPESVNGPIAVGYGAHFGLGCFVPSRM